MEDTNTGPVWASPDVTTTQDFRLVPDSDPNESMETQGPSDPMHEEEPPEIPLQFRAIFQECAPSNGSVGIEKLGKVLARAGTPAENAAELLRTASEGTLHVTEKHFYDALMEAARIQGDAHGEEPLKLSQEAAGDADYDTAPHYDPTSPDSIAVTLMDRREGSFLFRHAVYSVSGQLNGKSFRVVRRFRDFCWLLDQLVARYPFRALPVLPPKRLAVDGHYFSGDASGFLERRRQGLVRFINLVAQHPVLVQDPMVETFLFIDAQFETAKKTMKPSEEESLEVSALFMAQWHAPREARRWKSVRLATEEFLSQVTAICHALEREISRHRAAAVDADTVGRGLFALARSLPAAYPDQDNLDELQVAVEGSASVFSDDVRAQHTSAARLIAQKPLEQLRRYRDMLMSVHQLFIRLDIHGGNNISQLESRIRSTRAKLADRATKSDTKPHDLEKLQTIITEAQADIKRQTMRDWSIRRIVSRELSTVQATQLQVSRILAALALALQDDASNLGTLAAKIGDLL